MPICPQAPPSPPQLTWRCPLLPCYAVNLRHEMHERAQKDYSGPPFGGRQPDGQPKMTPISARIAAAPHAC